MSLESCCFQHEVVDKEEVDARGKAAVPIFRICSSTALGDALMELSESLGAGLNSEPEEPPMSHLTLTQLNQLSTLGPSVSQRVTKHAAIHQDDLLSQKTEEPEGWKFPSVSAISGSWVEVTAIRLGHFKWVTVSVHFHDHIAVTI
jgi:hypothetical protein